MKSTIFRSICQTQIAGSQSQAENSPIQRFPKIDWNEKYTEGKNYQKDDRGKAMDNADEVGPNYTVDVKRLSSRRCGALAL